MFTGTLRENLDPFGEHSDEDIIRAMAEVQPSFSRGRRVSSTSSWMRSREASDAAGQAATGGILDPTFFIALNADVEAGGLNFTPKERQVRGPDPRRYSPETDKFA